MKHQSAQLQARIVKEVTLDYLLYLPETVSAPLPLLLFLHGAGERGHNLDMVKRNGVPRRIEEGLQLPCIVVAPQCPPAQWWCVDALIALLDHICSEYPVDTNAQCVTGLSMGGLATWELASACPDRFSALAPICGPYTYVQKKHFAHVPIWCFHGAMDDIVPVQDSIRMVQQLRTHGANIRFTIYPDARHNAWTKTYENPAFYDWLLAQKRQAPAPRATHS